MNSKNHLGRREQIRSLLSHSANLGVEELARRFEVTTMTIRRDLAFMEREGLLLRTHGGCVLQSPIIRELSFSEKVVLHAAEKMAIAAEAVRRLRKGMSIYLDTGTTTLYAARQIPPGFPLSVHTNNLRVATELFGRDDVEVVVLGGVLAKRSPDLVGPLSLEHLKAFRFDIAIIGADAIEPVSGEYYSADLPTASLSAAVVARSRSVVILADSSKFDLRGTIVAGRLGAGVEVVTDDGIKKKDHAALHKTGATVTSVTCVHAAVDTIRGRGE